MTESPIQTAEIVEPRADALIESLRSFGYTPATSVADLIDNSLSSGATEIDVTFRWLGRDSWVAITDNGSGMETDALREAMRAGSSNPLEERSPEDLGRFGLGLKTASFAQARVLAVRSRTANSDESVRCWDLDHVQRTNRWELLASAPSMTPEIPHPVGTVVAWHHLDRIVDERGPEDQRAEAAFNSVVAEVHAHLEMVFHRFLEDGVQIRVNDNPCLPWDPFLIDHPDTDSTLPKERLPLISADGTPSAVIVTPYILPHNSKLSTLEHKRAAGPRGWNQHQGYYLYRASRLIVAGNWFDPSIKPEEHHKLARIRVEMTQEMDAGWALDVRKSRARPPSALRPDFRRIASATRRAAEGVYRTRGMRAVGRSRKEPSTTIWITKTDGAQLDFEINKSHPAYGEALDALGPAERRSVEALLRLICRYIPVSTILSEGFRNEDKFGLPSLTDEERSLGKRLFTMFLERMPPSEALSALAALQPFDKHPEYLGTLPTELDPDQ